MTFFATLHDNIPFYASRRRSIRHPHDIIASTMELLHTFLFVHHSANFVCKGSDWTNPHYFVRLRKTDPQWMKSDNLHVFLRDRFLPEPETTFSLAMMLRNWQHCLIIFSAYFVTVPEEILKMTLVKKHVFFLLSVSSSSFRGKFSGADSSFKVEKVCADCAKRQAFGPRSFASPLVRQRSQSEP